jgi:hypothetical protein
MSEYRYGYSDEVIVRTSDGAHIPDDPDNPDWAVYRKWLDAGGKPDPYAPPPLPGRRPIIPKDDG